MFATWRAIGTGCGSSPRITTVAASHTESNVARSTVWAPAGARAQSRWLQPCRRNKADKLFAQRPLRNLSANPGKAKSSAVTTGLGIAAHSQQSTRSGTHPTRPRHTLEMDYRGLGLRATETSTERSIRDPQGSPSGSTRDGAIAAKRPAEGVPPPARGDRERWLPWAESHARSAWSSSCRKSERSSFQNSRSGYSRSLVCGKSFDTCSAVCDPRIRTYLVA